MINYLKKSLDSRTKKYFLQYRKSFRNHKSNPEFEIKFERKPFEIYYKNVICNKALECFNNYQLFGFLEYQVSNIEPSDIVAIENKLYNIKKIINDAFKEDEFENFLKLVFLIVTFLKLLPTFFQFNLETLIILWTLVFFSISIVYSPILMAKKRHLKDQKELIEQFEIEIERIITRKRELSKVENSPQISNIKPETSNSTVIENQNLQEINISPEKRVWISEINKFLLKIDIKWTGTVMNFVEFLIFLKLSGLIKIKLIKSGKIKGENSSLNKELENFMKLLMGYSYKSATKDIKHKLVSGKHRDENSNKYLHKIISKKMSKFYSIQRIRHDRKDS